MFGNRLLFVISTITVLFNVSDGRLPKKIMKGTVAAPGEFPYQASIRIKDHHICGGSIIDERFVLTAAHCFATYLGKPHADIRVATGSSSSNGGTMHVISAITTNKKYNMSDHTSPFDIAVVELKEKLVFDKLRSSIKLPTSDLKGGHDAIAVGWGLETWPGQKIADDLMKVKLHAIDHDKCLDYTMNNITASQICTIANTGSGVCHGDSGGPLVQNGTLIGIVSYGVPCGRGRPDVYTNVYYFLDWIKRVMEL